MAVVYRIRSLFWMQPSCICICALTLISAISTQQSALRQNQPQNQRSIPTAEGGYATRFSLEVRL